MMNKEFNNKNRGAMFARPKRTSNSPEVGGDIEIGEDLIEYLNDCMARRIPAKLSISGWVKRDRRNQTFTSLALSIPFDANNQQTSQPSGYPNRGRDQHGNDRGYSRNSSPDRNVRSDQPRGSYRQESQGGMPYYGDQKNNDLDDDIPF